MELTVSTDIEVQTCRHGVCDCSATIFPIRVHGYVLEREDGLEAKVEDVSGLPESMTLADLDPIDEERFCELLLSEGYRRKDARARLGKELHLVATLLRLALSYQPEKGSREPGWQRAGALASAAEEAIKKLEQLTKSAA